MFIYAYVGGEMRSGFLKKFPVVLFISSSLAQGVIGLPNYQPTPSAVVPN